MFDHEIERFRQGTLLDAYRFLGAHPYHTKTEFGFTFTVYAPQAQEIEVVGDFNHWNGSNHKMTRFNYDYWTINIPNLKDYDTYKYHIRTPYNTWIDKADPFAFFSELRPNTGSRLYDLEGFPWWDGDWLKSRTKNMDQPLSIYEMHFGSWRKKWDGTYYSYEELAAELIPYALDRGFTHIELMPLLENPLDLSWGYLCTGYFSATSRYGNPKQLMYFIDQCHRHGLGVIMDFVPVHFIKDAHGLHQFDGTNLYEYQDEHRRYSQWGSVNFNLFKEEVRSFIMSSAAFWIEKFHIDGIRFDAVSNLIYWGGRGDYGTNPGALDFVKRMNHLLSEKYPQVMLIAEDSSDFQGVTKPTFDGGLGFDYKWDLGWMNDTLKYYAKDPIYRKFHHHNLTFSMHYFYSEKFVMPLSHDEVVHGKGTILNKMWGTYNEKFDQVRNLYTYMYVHPGKKLNFMGNELGQFDEWAETKTLDWNLLDFQTHQGIFRLFRDLNQIYKFTPALHVGEYDPRNFRWIMHGNSEQSIYSFTREVNDSKIIAVFNMTPMDYYDYEMGVPWAGSYTELINSDKDVYGGGNRFNYDRIFSQPGESHGCHQFIRFRIAPFAAIVFIRQD